MCQGLTLAQASPNVAHTGGRPRRVNSGEQPLTAPPSPSSPSGPAASPRGTQPDGGIGRQQTSVERATGQHDLLVRR